MKKYRFKIIKWRWDCGDGCCSDSGTEIECCPIFGESGPSYSNDNVRNIYDGIPSYIITDAIYRMTESKNPSDFRKQCFEAFGVEDKTTDWNWSSALPSVSDNKAKEIFAKFGFDVEFDEEDVER